jgi:hypothetical protein
VVNLAKGYYVATTWEEYGIDAFLKRFARSSQAIRAEYCEMLWEARS